MGFFLCVCSLYVCPVILIFVPTGLSYSGREFDDMDTETQRKACLTAKLFSRVEPAHKSKIVDYLQKDGAVSAMVRGMYTSSYYLVGMGRLLKVQIPHIFTKKYCEFPKFGVYSESVWLVWVGF